MRAGDGVLKRARALRDGVIVLSLVTFTAATAGAQESTKKWVGTPNVVVDSASFGLIVLGVGGGVAELLSEPHPGKMDALTPWLLFGVLGVGGLVLGSPIVHVASGHADRAGASLGLRALATSALVGSALHLNSGTGATKFKLGLLFLATTGFIAAAIVDDALIARDNVRTTGAAASALSPKPPVMYAVTLPF